MTEQTKHHKTHKIHKIVKYPEPVLAKKAEPVTVFDESLRQLAEEMFATMYDARGVGLAAPQIGIPKQLTVIDVPNQKNPEDQLVLANPEVVSVEGSQYEEEGCLSLGDIREKVKRAANVKVRAQNLDGVWIEVEGDTLLARCLLHEIDHLNGLLFLDRLSRLKRELIVRRIRKLIKAGEW
jgi:peptide deformylase